MTDTSKNQDNSIAQELQSVIVNANTMSDTVGNSDNSLLNSPNLPNEASQTQIVSNNDDQNKSNVQQENNLVDSTDVVLKETEISMDLFGDETTKSEAIKNECEEHDASTIAQTGDEPVAEATSNNPLDGLKATVTTENFIYKLTIDVPECTQRRDLSVVCVIDVSGSMGSSVGKAEGKGNKAFTRLDLVKHVLNVIISSLSPSDQLALVLFTTEARIGLNLTYTTDANKQIAKDCVNKMKADASTFTFKGLEMGYNIIKDAPEDNVKSIILLTDGEDTEGHVTLLNKFSQLKVDPKIQLNTFGFSNDIKSATLEQLALKGGGIFGFIPDQTMIGTIFVNFMASLFMTYAQNVPVSIDSKNFELISPKIQTDKVSFYYGQPKNFLLKRRTHVKPEDFEFKIKVGNCDKKKLKLSESNKVDLIAFKQQEARKKLLQFLTDKNLPNINIQNYIQSPEIKIVPEFLSEFKQIDEYCPNNEQLSLALKDYAKWGGHYIRSMYFAHQNEQCLNYKSPSMQIYTNIRFNKLVDTLTDTFVTLPLPTPTGTSYNEAAPQITTRGMMNRYGGCILGTCSIKMENAEYKPIHSLKKDDVLFGGAKIVCLVKMKYKGPLAKIGRLFITPFHPVYIDSKWQFPYDVVMNNNHSASSSNGLIIESGDQNDEYVFNIVLDKHHIVDVEGVGCITLGHMYDEGILKHDYFGTNKVIEDLSKLNGWNEGFISLQSYKIQRDSNSNVCGFTDFVY